MYQKETPKIFTLKVSSWSFLCTQISFYIIELIFSEILILFYIHNYMCMIPFNILENQAYFE